MASEPIYKVFVSSTSQDLHEERAKVQQALLKLNCLPVSMELFPAADDETWEFIKQQIDDSDYYVVLVAGRYGSIAADGVSFTEKEYDYARQKGIPSIGFVHFDRAKIASGQTDSDPDLVRKLDAFISKIKKRPVREFRNPHDLASEVISSFVDLKRTRPRIGFVRTNEAVEYRKYTELLEKYTELEKQMRDLRIDARPFPRHDVKISIAVTRNGVARLVEGTLGQAFVVLASITLRTRWEDMIASGFTKAVAMWTSKPGDPRFATSDFTTIREDLFALNLIEVAAVQRTVEGTSTIDRRSWAITEYGRKQFSLLRFANQTQA